MVLTATGNHRRNRAFVLVGVLAAHSAGAGPRADTEGPVPATARARRPVSGVRGLTVSCRRWGQEWGSPDMRELMETLPEVGANWIAIHPYARVSRETGEVLHRPGRPLAHVARPIRWARELGLGIMIKPHLAYWGEFGWRGEIGWNDEERWQRFRETYRAFILDLATVCEREGADLFVVGTELRRAEPMAEWWRALISEVRTRFSGPLTYAANWDDYRRVPFWSSLDHVGVQAYFPLTDEPDPSQLLLDAAWKARAAELGRFSEVVDRPVLVTEVGYTSSSAAAARPWESSRGPGPTHVQERCLRAALRAVREDRRIEGAFVWKWFPTTASIGPHDFTVQTPAFKRLLRAVWTDGERETAPPATEVERGRSSDVAPPR